MRPSGSPVFLTGVPRSGTTWVGRVLTANPNVFGIDEPFNPRTRQRLPLDYPARHLEPDAPLVISAGLRRAVSGLLALRLHVPRGVDVRRPKELVRAMGDGERVLEAKIRRATVVIKDPTANFLTAWLHREFGLRPAVLVRHPCGNAAGYLRMGWSGMKYLERPGRVAQLRPDDRDYLEPYRNDLTGNPVLSAALDWRVTNGMLLAWRDAIPDLVVVRYEDLATDPTTRFPELAAQLGLRWEERNVAELHELSGEAIDPAALGSNLHVMRRDSTTAASSWRERLSQAEVATVLKHAGPLAEELGYGP